MGVSPNKLPISVTAHVTHDIGRTTRTATSSTTTPRGGSTSPPRRAQPLFLLFDRLRAGPPFSWGVTSGAPPGGRSLYKDGTRADSAKDFAV